MPFGKPDYFEAAPFPKSSNDGWGTSGAWLAPPKIQPDFHNDEEKKKLFGIELAKNHSSPFSAACVIFKEDTQASMWVTQNWMNDPIVNAAKDLYAKTLIEGVTLLDKNELAAKLLKFADEKDLQTNRYVIDAKERLAALQLYAKVCGFVDNVSIDNSTNLTLKTINLKFVKPDITETVKTINHPVQDNVTDFDKSLRIKLVK